jgi:predicted TIM-barrel fold metal-dependent hydrolase
MDHEKAITRRRALAASAGVVAGMYLGRSSNAAADERLTTAATTNPSTAPTTSPWNGPIIDIHQHTTYQGRSDEVLLHHQTRMGVTQTILLPSGTPSNAASTLKGKANGLYAGAGPINTVVPIAEAHAHEYFYFANEVPDLPNAPKTISDWLKKGALGIGEQKFNLPVDSPEMEAIYAVAQEFNVPILMHFQYETFNTGYERFGEVLKKWSKVNFIGHAVTFWANIDARIRDQQIFYPKGKVTAGGLTDRYLSDYPNFHGDLSAGSGLNALIRDEDHARGFIDRHQAKLMFGSDCSDHAGAGPTCSGSGMIAAIRRLSADEKVAERLLYGNAKKMFNMLA